jgi:filamentous hemagglutinin
MPQNEAAAGAAVLGIVAALNFAQDPGEAVESAIEATPPVQALEAVIAASSGRNVEAGEHIGHALLGAATLGLSRFLTGCFVGDTEVWTSEGLVPIRSLEPGDWVLAQADDGTGDLDWKQVLEVYEREPSSILDLELQDDGGLSLALGVTPEHPFWRHGDEWVEAGDLQPDDRVWSVERGWLWVRSVHERPEHGPVYNLNVEDHHTYVVGGLGVWVHNVCGDNAKQAQRAQLEANKKQGAAFEAQATSEARRTQTGVVGQLTIRSESGTKTRLDLAGRDKVSNAVKLTEAKSSETAGLTPNQKRAFPEIARSGGTVAGRGKPGFPGGTKIPPTTVDIVRPKKK